MTNVREQLDERAERRARHPGRAVGAKAGEIPQQVRRGGAAQVENPLVRPQPDAGVEHHERARHVERRPELLNQLVLEQERGQFAVARPHAQPACGRDQRPHLAVGFPAARVAVLPEAVAQVRRLADVQRLVVRPQPLVDAGRRGQFVDPRRPELRIEASCAHDRVLGRGARAPRRTGTDRLASARPIEARIIGLDANACRAALPAAID